MNEIRLVNLNVILLNLTVLHSELLSLQLAFVYGQLCQTHLDVTETPWYNSIVCEVPVNSGKVVHAIIHRMAYRLDIQTE